MSTLIVALHISTSVQAVTVIDFDSTGVSGPFTSITTEGYTFTSNPTPTGTTLMGLVAGEINCNPDCPDNDTYYLIHIDFGDLQLHSITMAAESGIPFSFVSFDAGERNIGLAYAETLEITGAKVGAGTVSASFNLDGINDGSGPLIDFQTFLLPSTFTNLTSVNFLGLADPSRSDLTQGYSLDNASVSAVPLPAAAWLFGTGLLGLIGMSTRKKAA